MKIYVQFPEDITYDLYQENYVKDFIKKEDYLKLYYSKDELINIECNEEDDGRKFNIIVSKSKDNLAGNIREFNIIDIITLKEDEFLFLNYNYYDNDNKG